MKRRGSKTGFNPHQLQLDWRSSVAAGSPSRPQETLPGELFASSPDGDGQRAAVGTTIKAPPLSAGSLDLVQVLPWDFATTFPKPMEDAIEAGAIGEEDAGPENVKSLHAEIARQLLKVLAERDALSDSRRRGVDPKTGEKPRTRGGKERLKKYCESEPGQLDRTWQAIIGSYEAAFGEHAADAFGKAIRAGHAGIPVVAEQPDAASSASAPPQSPSASAVADGDDPESLYVKNIGRDGRRVIARLPVPKPLPHAVAAGHFGQDENGPVNPSADEVRDITLNHAETLIDLLAEQRDAERSGSDAEKLRVTNEIQNAAVKYAEDFGFAAAEQLMAYARRQMLINGSPRGRPGSGRG